MQWEIIIAKLCADKYRVLYLSRSLCYCCQIVNTLFLRSLYLSVALALSMCMCLCLRASECDTLWIVVCLCHFLCGYCVHVNELAWVNKRPLKNRFDMYAVAVAIVSNKVYTNNRTEYNVCQNHHTLIRTHQLAFEIPRFSPLCPFCHIVKPNHYNLNYFITHKAHSYTHISCIHT